MKKRGRLFLSKKAEITNEVYNVLIQIAIIVMILVAGLTLVNSVRKNTLFEKMYLVRDLALFMNTLYAAPENVKVEYSVDKINLDDYKFNALDNYIIVNEKDSTDIHEKYYKYANDLNFHEDFDLITDSKAIFFLKNNNEFIVDKSVPDYLNDLICPKLDVHNKDLHVIIDPGHGDDPNRPQDPNDPGYVTEALKESSMTTQIASVLQQSFGYGVTRTYDYYISIEERLNILSQADIIISLHLGNYSADENAVRAFISAQSDTKKESRALACYILNNLAKQAPYSTAIIPVFVSELEKEDPKQVLQFTDKISVLLEIGNINNPESIESLQPYEIAVAIHDGINIYYD